MFINMSFILHMKSEWVIWPFKGQWIIRFHHFRWEFSRIITWLISPAYCQLTSTVSIFNSCLSLSVTLMSATFDALTLTFSPAHRSWWHWALSKNSCVRISRSSSLGDPDPQCICFRRLSFDLIWKINRKLNIITSIVINC